PVVVADGHDYIEWNHYSPAAVRRRLVYIADPAAAAAYGRSDTTEKEVAVLPEFAGLRVVTLQEFVDTHSQFLLYSRVSWENKPDWWVLRLLADGYSVKKLAGEGDSTMYLVGAERANVVDPAKMQAAKSFEERR